MDIREQLREPFLEVVKDQYRRIPDTVNMLNVFREIGTLLTAKPYDPVWDINYNTNGKDAPSSPSMFELRRSGDPITLYQCKIDHKFGALEAYPCGKVLYKEPVDSPSIMGITIQSKMGTQDDFVHIVKQVEGFFLVNPSAISVWYPIRFERERLNGSND